MHFAFSVASVQWIPYHKNLSILEFENSELVTSLFGLNYQTYLDVEEDALITELTIDICYLGLMIKTFKDIKNYFIKDRSKDEAKD